ncbi:MAG: sulfotransferase family 2 domain-containing protein [Cyanobacteria bacterium P01_D01_bin.50]
MISHKHQVIFIHIPKTAGSSIEKKLGLYEEVTWGVQDHRTVKQIRPLSLFNHSRYLFNPTALRTQSLSRYTMLNEMLGLPTDPRRHGPRATEREFASYFKFTVVRNPWSRVYSWYRNVMRGSRHGVPACDFPTFLGKFADNWGLRPQTYWIADFDGSIPLDRIVRFENLAEEMVDVLTELGFKDCNLPYLLKSKNTSDYRTAYDDLSAELVAKRYSDEIEMFNYDF